MRALKVEKVKGAKWNLVTATFKIVGTTPYVQAKHRMGVRAWKNSKQCGCSR